MLKNEFAMGRGVDGRIHGFYVCDDGAPSRGAMCSPEMRSEGKGDDQDECCDACLPLIAEFLFDDEQERADFLAKVRAGDFNA